MEAPWRPLVPSEHINWDGLGPGQKPVWTGEEDSIEVSANISYWVEQFSDFASHDHDVMKTLDHIY